MSRDHRCGTYLYYSCNNSTWGRCTLKNSITEPRKGLFCKSYKRPMKYLKLQNKGSVNMEVNNVNQIVINLDNFNIATLLTGGEVHVGINTDDSDSYTDVVVRLSNDKSKNGAIKEFVTKITQK